MQEVHALSVPALCARVLEIVAAHKTLLRLKTLVFEARGIVADTIGPCLHSLSEDVRKRGLRAAAYWGVDVLLPPGLLQPRPCAVKVLTEESCLRGAYGSRSLENEVRFLASCAQMAVKESARNELRTCQVPCPENEPDAGTHYAARLGCLRGVPICWQVAWVRVCVPPSWCAGGTGMC